MQQVIGLAPYYTVIVLIAVGLVLGFGAMLAWGRRLEHEPLVWALFLIAAVIVTGPIASGRNLSGIGAFFDVDAETLTASVWMNRVVNIIILMLAFERIGRLLLSRTKQAVEGWPLFIAFAVFVVTNSFVNGAWGTRPQFFHQSIYTLAAVFAAGTMIRREHMRFVSFYISSVLMILLLSAAVLVVKPSLVLQQGYVGGLLPVRYYGLGTHANTLSPIIIGMLLCLWHQPFRTRWLNILAWTLGAGSLLLTQSKTTIAAGMLAMLVLAAFRVRERLAARRDQGNTRAVVIGVLAVGMTTVAALLVLQVAFDFGQLLRGVSGTQFGQQTGTLSNRDQIWYFAIQEWHRNPWFGYGPSIFDLEYRARIGLSQAFHAHNQFMQSLGAAGYVGVAGLLLFTITLIVYAWRAAVPSRGLTAALLTFIVLRGVTEVPFALKGVTNGEFLFVLVTYVVCLAYQPVPRRTIIQWQGRPTSQGAGRWPVVT